MTTPARALDLALRAHRARPRAGRAALPPSPPARPAHYIEALHLLGLVTVQLGRPDQAIDYIGQAIRLKPDFAPAHKNLGLVLIECGRREEAARATSGRSSSGPTMPTPTTTWGLCERTRDGPEDAVASYQRAIQLEPDFAGAHCNLGVALEAVGTWRRRWPATSRRSSSSPITRGPTATWGCPREQGRLVEAVASFQGATQLKPDYAKAHNNLGVALEEQGRLEEAVASFQRAIGLKPDFAEAHNNLGLALAGAGAAGGGGGQLSAGHAGSSRTAPRPTTTWGLALQARAGWRRRWPAISGPSGSSPTTPRPTTTWGCPCGAGRLEEAVASFRAGLQLKPDYAEAHNNLGLALRSRAGWRRRWPAISGPALQPDYAEAHNNLGNALHGAGQAGGGGGQLSAGPAAQARLCRGPQQPGNRPHGPGPAGGGGGQLCSRPCGSSRTIAEAHKNLGDDLAPAGRLRARLARIRMALEVQGASRCPRSASRSGTARPWTDEPSCSTPNRDWATRCSSFAMRRW